MMKWLRGSSICVFSLLELVRYSLGIRQVSTHDVLCTLCFLALLNSLKLSNIRRVNPSINHFLLLPDSHFLLSQIWYFHALSRNLKLSNSLKTTVVVYQSAQNIVSSKKAARSVSALSISNCTLGT